jgi:hypothetical protein
MVPAHAATADGDGDWRYAAEVRPDGAVLTVRANVSSDVAGLGFFGLLARGTHHQEHHLRIVRGEPPHH